MFCHNVGKNKKEKNESVGFNTKEVIAIMIVTALCAMTLTIKVTYSLNNTSRKIKTETELSELINIYEGISNNYYEEVNKEQMISSAIEAMVEYLDDPYSTYLDPKEAEALNDELNGEYEGIGLQIKKSDNKSVIHKVFDNSPSSKAGLKEKDIIIKIDNENVENMSLDKVSALIKGKKTSKFSVTVKRGKKDITVTLNRQKVDLQSVEYKEIKKDSKRIAVFSINVFAKNTYTQFKQALSKAKLDKDSCIIIDLRSNKGGYLVTAKSIAEMFLNKGDIIYQTSTKDGVEKIINKKEQIINNKTAVLVNSVTASASEVLASSLNENLNVDIVGTTTYGKGTVQQTKILSNGSVVKFTTENWLTSKGNKIDQKGIEPTLKVNLSDAYTKNRIDKNDNQLQSAVELLLKGKKS